MNWQETLHEGAFTAENFLFADGGRLDLRLAYRTVGELASDKGNAVLLLHGTVGSGQQFLQPLFADALFDPGEPLDAREHFIILPDAIGHGKSSKPSDGLEQDFPRYGYGDVVEAQHRLVTEGLGLSRLRLVGRFHGSNRMPAKTGSPRCRCDTTANEEPTMPADMSGFMENRSSSHGDEHGRDADLDVGRAASGHDGCADAGREPS
jgi:pimeloyl-ACP methyl ester carboxylesterase